MIVNEVEFVKCCLQICKPIALVNLVVWLQLDDGSSCSILCLCAPFQTPGQASATLTSWADAVLTCCRSVCPRASAAARTEDAGPDPLSQRCVPSAEQVRMRIHRSVSLSVQFKQLYLSALYLFFYLNDMENSQEQLNNWNSILNKHYKRQKQIVNNYYY